MAALGSQAGQASWHYQALWILDMGQGSLALLGKRGHLGEVSCCQTWRCIWKGRGFPEVCSEHHLRARRPQFTCLAISIKRLFTLSLLKYLFLATEHQIPAAGSFSCLYKKEKPWAFQGELF